MRGRYPRQNYKTEITGPSSGDQTNTPNLNLCIIHQKPHPLSKCRAFRAKPIYERKNLIRQHRLCFHCLASNTHMAKDCKLPVKCTEYENDKHLAALHVERKLKPKDREEVQGGEQRNGQQDGTDKLDKQQSGEPNRITIYNVYQNVW